MFKKFYSLLTLTAIISVFAIPALSQAALVKCGNSITIQYDSNGEALPEAGPSSDECDFTDFVRLLNDLINWFITGVGLLFTGLLVWGGFEYMTSNGNAATKQKAIDRLWGTLKGFIIILCAWLIVYTIVNLLAAPDQKNSILKFLVK